MQTEETVGMGTVTVLLVLVLLLVLEEMEDEQTGILEVVVGGLLLTTTGGFLLKQSPLLHCPPWQLFPQYVPTCEHQDWYLVHCWLAGYPAVW